MAKKYLDYDGLLYFWQKIKNVFVSDVTYNSSTNKIQKTKAGSASDVVTLSTVATSGSYNDLSNKPTIPTIPNGFANVKVGSTTVAADTTTDTLELVAGSNVTLTPDATNDKVTIAATDTIYSDFTGATSSAEGAHGLVPAPHAGDHKSILFGNSDWGQIKLNLSLNKILSIHYRSRLSSGEWGSWASLTDTVTLSEASTTLAGLMSSGDKTKLNGIAEGAEVNVNADWNASSGDAQILNKPTLGAAAAKGVVTSISSDSANLPTATAVKNYVATAITGAAAFQGTAPTSFAPTNYKKGYYWVVGTAGTYVGQTCEAGDMIFAVEDYASSYKASDFNVIQTNLDITAITNAEIDTIVAA